MKFPQPLYLLFGSAILSFVQITSSFALFTHFALVSSALDACQLNPCPYPYANCSVSASGVRECSCPQICTADYNPVCGTDGQTYDNKCQMRVTACSQGMMIKVKSHGSCNSKFVLVYSFGTKYNICFVCENTEIVCNNSP